MTAPKKVRAPRPVPGGREAQAQAVAEARQVFELSVRGEVVGRIALGNVPLDEKLAVRQQVRVPWQDIIGQTGVSLDVWNLSVLVWLAKRASGEPSLTYESFTAGWDNTVRADEIDLEKVNPDVGDDDPQP